MVDRVNIYIKAGDGGNGAVSFRRERFIPRGGPDGGNGGNGGDIYMETDPEGSTLQDFANRQKFLAGKGMNGGGEKKTGKSGDDLIIKIPIGTLVKVGEGMVLDFDKRDMRIMVAKGGKGGMGNDHFKSSINRTPMEAQEGEKGAEFWLELELKLLADVGLIGLPNVGKSTLLSVLSNAKPKIADYEFTTLEPNLGVMKYKGETLVLADIPGLIEGASMGKGLGDAFLRHIERTRVLVHVVAVKEDEEVADLWKKYRTIRKELKQYGAGLQDKEEIVALNKIDLINQSEVEKVVKFFAKKKVKVWPISSGNLEGVDILKNKILEIAK